MKKVVLGILVVLALLIVGLLTFIFASWDKKFEAPEPAITASTDSAVIARGRYLAFGPAHCASCHMPMDKFAEVEAGAQFPLSGGWELPIAPGTFRAPNITPDKETGIGTLSDGQLARAMRHSVKHDGSALFPFMPFQDISDEDLTAIISFLRSQEPVKNEIKPTELSLLGKALMAFGAITPVGPKATPPKTMKPDSTIEYGSYIANSVANCVGCHTERDMKTGVFIGEPFAGGLRFEPDPFSGGYSFISPNLTPDAETGVIADWSERTFLSRLHNGRQQKGSPMTWGLFSRMNDMELKAVYRYLKSLKPVKKKIEQTVFGPAEKFPEI